MMNKFDVNFRTVMVAAAVSLVVTVVVTLGLFTYLVAQTRSAGAISSAVGSSEQNLVINAVKKTNPAVVSITVSKSVPVVGRLFDPNNMFNDFFGFTLPLPQYRQQGTQKQEIGGGSGFLVSSDGHIVTNRHVVEDPEAEYTVFTNDGKKHPAKVVAQDPVLDVAVLKIDGAGYPTLAFGDSDLLQVGQTAIAIGNALGEFRNTVSVGVISGLSRSIVAGDPTSQESETLDQVIQTDAAINRGNSGGPLLNLDGQVIGINVAIAAGSENVGFALPVNSLKQVVAQVVRDGKIVRPYLGIRYVQITSELQAKNKLAYDYGVLVSRGPAGELAVIPGSPADKAGIVENDIVLEAGGTRLDGDHSLASIIRQKKVGDPLVLKVVHRGVVKTVTVKLEAMPS